MPATRPHRKRISGAASQAPPRRPSTPYPGYLTDEWVDYAIAMMEREKPEKIRRDLVKLGILDKNGNYTARPRNE